MRIAWFTPLRPIRSGISRYSEELLPSLAAEFDLDAFDVARAHEFVWRHFTRPYDLTVYQLGNAACHDYMWPYLVRYPGLTVLHDAQLHQSRAAALLSRQRRPDDYRAEFVFNHPEADRGVAELVIHGLAGEVLHFWPLRRAVISASRAIAVHSEGVASTLRDEFSDAEIQSIPMGVPPHVANVPAAVIRERHGIPANAILCAAIGRITPEKRIAAALRALASLAPQFPGLYLMLVGEVAPYFDLASQARECGVAERIVTTGYVEDDALGDYIAAADLCLCLRWPTNGETSASWLRCLAAAKPTVITDLVHLAHLPALDPRTWAPVPDAHGASPVAVTIDILDEDHSLTLAMRRLAGDEALRRELGARAHAYWQHHHTVDHMTAGYRHAIAAAAAQPIRRPALPPHLTADGVELAERIASEFPVDVGFLRTV